jgi:hypothetical protein
MEAAERPANAPSLAQMQGGSRATTAQPPMTRPWRGGLAKMRAHSVKKKKKKKKVRSSQKSLQCCTFVYTVLI